MKFDFRVGIALAAAAISASCSGTPQQALTAPSVTSATAGPVSAATASDGSTMKVNPPAQVTPINSERVNDRRPTLVWANAVRRYADTGVAYDIQISTATAVVYEVTVGETPDFGQHLLPFDLEYDVTYWWRVRAREPREGGEIGPWSGDAQFQSPLRPAPVVSITPGGSSTCAAPVSPVGPGETRKPRPNDSAIVRAVADAFPAALRGSCQEHGGSWEFMDRAVDALRTKDGRYGYNAKRGNMNDPSVDVASYYYHPEIRDIHGRPEVYIFDLIGGHCGPSPFVVWNDVTDITFQSGTLGRTMYPRPGRNVTVTGPCGSAASR
jgi:hypothetical protein